MQSVTKGSCIICLAVNYSEYINKLNRNNNLQIILNSQNNDIQFKTFPLII